MHHRTIAAAVALAVTSLGATVLASADAAPSHHAAARGGSFTVTASVNKSEPLQGDKIKIKGSVRPAAPGARVTLRLRYENKKKWKTVATGTLSARSRFKFKDKVTTVRPRKYRVVKPAGPNRAGGHSPSLQVTVFGWRDLTSLNPVISSGFVEYEKGVKMNGVAYPNSLRYPVQYPGTPNSIDYNLNRACKSFRGVVGLDDSSPATGSAWISLSTDGIPQYAGYFALTQTAPVSLDLTNVFRLTAQAVPDFGGLAAVGTPQVLCSF
jgi:hypothetical protein